MVCPGVGNKLEAVGSLTLTMDANNNVTVEEVSGKAAITNASGTYKIEGDYDYVAKVGTRAPQFDLEYTYENLSLIHISIPRGRNQRNKIWVLRLDCGTSLTSRSIFLTKNVKTF